MLFPAFYLLDLPYCPSINVGGVVVMLTYTTKQLAEELHTSRNYIDDLRKSGLLQGIKKGNAYIYYEEEVKKLLEQATGHDLSNKQKMDEFRRFIK